MKHLAISNTEARSCAVERFIETLGETGKKFTTGTVTFATANSQQIIYHNLGVKPRYFCLYPLFEPNYDKTNYGEAFMYTYFRGAENGIPELSEKCNCWVVNQNNGLTGQGVQDPYAFDSNAINGEYVKTRTVYQYNNYAFKANKEFGWIAIE